MKTEVKEAATEAGIDISEIAIIDPASVSYFEELAEKFVERRKGKATLEQAREQLKDVNYFGTMLVYTGRADGLSEWGGAFNCRYSTTSTSNY